MKKLLVPFRWIDEWLCLYLKPWQLRIFWQDLWVRADEFHPSTNNDIDAVFKMQNKISKAQTKLAQYKSSMVTRRWVAHNRHMERQDRLQNKHLKKGDAQTPAQ